MVLDAPLYWCHHTSRFFATRGGAVADEPVKNDMLLLALQGLAGATRGHSLESARGTIRQVDELAADVLQARRLDSLAASVEGSLHQSALIADLLPAGTLASATPESVTKLTAEFLRKTSGVLATARDKVQSISISTEQLRGLEAIIRLTGRPSFLVQNGTVDKLAAETQWPTLVLKSVQERYEAVIASVGRVYVTLPGRRAVGLGTAWVAGDGIVATNRHVAEEFGTVGTNGKTWSLIEGAKVHVDFLVEERRLDALEFNVTSILHVEPKDGPDLALLRIEKIRADGRQLPPPLRLAKNTAEVRDSSDEVFVVGYPGLDPDANREALERIFTGIYGRKRLAPGFVMEVHLGSSALIHDCTTLPGSSGSCVVRAATGKVVGLHFLGTQQVENEAVLVAGVQQRLSPFALNWAD
ncbi:serine protease [Corallococcus sp. AS-1-12]|uniref:trypsin-like serine peptidase n=1 Tax=Corallococcus sp. AS-1-12 TaxID=2874598 RepID=UPI001CBF7C35|nr:serine protease [Corallococcus sp. AS-1-12]MBZ4333468.1 serine protease [Corallococcus sp. AS-1-12]